MHQVSEILLICFRPIFAQTISIVLFYVFDHAIWQGDGILEVS